MSKPKFRQAVLLIHGIGEQRPMSTLRSFVTALVRDDFRSKPDDLSKSFELRRLTYYRKLDEAEHQTCFFEYYWAYRLRDTSYRHVIDWARRLLGTRWRNVPPRLRWVWLFCYITIVFGSLAAVAIVLLSTPGWEAWSTSHGAVPSLDGPDCHSRSLLWLRPVSNRRRCALPELGAGKHRGATGHPG